ncbi:MAG: hypothetical protein JWQ79_1866 [Mucilaginibacter sp.]|nr:hypothetical protein [Mucilaginibacter sp.]
MDDNFDIDEFEESQKELDETFSQIKQSEEHSTKEITKYFDRIHDKLFSLNNIYIAAYIALIVFRPTTSKLIVLVPLLNCCFLVYIDWRMMEASRLNSKISELSDIGKPGRMLQSVNLLSFGVIVMTFIVTAVFFAAFYWSK